MADDADVRTSAEALSIAATGLVRDIGRVNDSNRFELVSLTVADGSVALSRRGDSSFAHLVIEAETAGQTHGLLPPRLLADVARSLPRGDVDLSIRDGAMEIQSGRTSFSLALRQGEAAQLSVPSMAIELDAGRYLLALRRISTAIDGVRTVDDDVKIRLHTVGSELTLEFDTFEIAATESVSGMTDSQVDRLLVTSAERFAAMVAHFGVNYPAVRIGASGNDDVVWMSGRHRLHPVTLAFGSSTWASETRDPARLRAVPLPHHASFSAPAILAALRRCALATDGDGGYATLCLDAGEPRVRILTHGRLASAAEWVPCEYGGPRAEITFLLKHLEPAIKHLPSDFKLSFGDPAKPVVITNDESYTCILRPLPPAPPGEAQHSDFFQNVPFPRSI
jgi:hypothetical protein